MGMSDEPPTPIHPFAGVRTALGHMRQVLDGGEVDMIALAKAYAALAQAMHADVLRAGQTSMRFEAVVKALDLRTPKSQLARFLGTD